MRLSLAWLGLIGGCAAPAPFTPSHPFPHPEPTPIVSTDAAEESSHPSGTADATMAPRQVEDAGLYGATGPWVVFRGPAGPMNTPMHGGPPWEFTWPGLPAISASGTAIVLPFRVADGLAARPNFALRTIASSGGQTLRDVELLTLDEFDNANESPDKTGSFMALAQRVAARTAAANDDMSSAGWKPMHSCKVVEEPYSVYPPCSMTSQHVECGDRKLEYGRQTLRVQHGAHRWSQRFPSWKRGNVPVDFMPGGMPLAECMGGAWLDDAGRTLVVELWYMCQGGGDWCSEEPAWKAVAIGR